MGEVTLLIERAREGDRLAFDRWKTEMDDQRERWKTEIEIAARIETANIASQTKMADAATKAATAEVEREVKE